jgi:hypothetical protein
MSHYEFVLARSAGEKWGPSIWNFYETLEAATTAASEINRQEKGEPYTPMTYVRFQELERAFWLKEGPSRISAEKFHDMLNVLPPMRWKQEGAFNSFLMSERMSGTFTYQYAQLGFEPGAVYFQKMVDLADATTFMTEKNVRELCSLR